MSEQLNIVQRNNASATPSGASPSFLRSANQNDLVADAADRFISVVSAIVTGEIAGVSADGKARVVLTGGGAGTQLLAEIASRTSDIDWSKVLVFFGDERFVPANSTDRNAFGAYQALLDKIDIPAENIFEIDSPDSTQSPEEAANNYTKILAENAADGFDIHLLGMGGEGHINSLFPHTDELMEQSEMVVAVHDCPKPPPTRVSLTMPAVARSRRVWLLVSGAAKAAAVAAIAAGADPAQWPAVGARGSEETIVFVDDAAAAELV